MWSIAPDRKQPVKLDLTRSLYIFCLMVLSFTCDHSGAQIQVNTMRPRQNGRHSADDIFKGIFLNENVRNPIKISLKFVPKGPINNIPSLVQIMTWCRPGDKPLSEPMLFSLLTHICVTRPQWVNADKICGSPPIYSDWQLYSCNLSDKWKQSQELNFWQY